MNATPEIKAYDESDSQYLASLQVAAGVLDESLGMAGHPVQHFECGAMPVETAIPILENYTARRGAQCRAGGLKLAPGAEAPDPQMTATERCLAARGARPANEPQQVFTGATARCLAARAAKAAATLALLLSAFSATGALQVLLNGGTNNVAPLSTNSLTPRYFVVADGFVAASVFVEAKAIATDETYTLAPLTLRFAAGNGLTYETTPQFSLTLTFSTTNQITTAAENFELGALPNLMLLSVENPSTNCFFTNIVVHGWPKKPVYRQTFSP
jgi:hypothetical protein